MAEVAVYKNEARDTEDYVFVAVYDKNGMLLNIDYVRSNFAPNYDYSIGFNIPAQNREIGSIKDLCCGADSTTRSRLRKLRPSSLAHSRRKHMEF